MQSNIKKELLFQELLNKNEQDSLQQWIKCCKDCRETQERVLKEILMEAKDSMLGKKYDFASIKTIEEFQNKVPISEYEAIQDEIELMAEGREDILFQGRTEYFISTSGTTGISKKIPESKNSMEAKKAVNKLRKAFLMGELYPHMKKSPRFAAFLKHKQIDPKDVTPKELMKQFHFYSVTSAIAGQKTSGGIDIGYASGKTFENSDFAENLAYPKELMSLKDGEATMYLTMLFGLRYDDVAMVTSNNAGRLYARIEYAKEHAKELLHDLTYGTIKEDIILSEEERKIAESYMTPQPERAKELQKLLDQGKEFFIPKYYWPYLMVARFWLSGSVGVNVKKIRKYLPDDLLYFDIGYGASEGKINIPFQKDLGCGTLGIASLFFEFQSMEDNRILTADQLEDGKEYDLILTNFGGLYRYPLHDVVQVKGFMENTPNIEFITKSKEILNIAQEKLPASSVLSCMNQLALELGTAMKQAQIFPDNENSRYVIFMELEGNSSIDFNISNFEELLDNRLKEGFDLYGRNRKFESLQAPQVVLMKNGWQDNLFALKEQKGTPKSQIKLESMIIKVPENKWILKREES